MTKTTAISAIISAAALFIAAPAAAQPHQHGQADSQQMDAQGMMGGQMKDGMMMGQSMMQGMMDCPMMGQSHGQPRTEGRLAFLKAELKIESNQEATWNKYAEAVRASHQGMAEHMAKMHEKMMKKDDTAQIAERLPEPKALQNRIAMMEGMLANLKSVEAATSKLYDKLDQSQKATADELLSMPCGMMRM